MFQLGGLGLDVWNGATHTSLASLTAKNKAHMSSDGEIFLLSTPDSCAQGFAIAIAALLQISAWASERLNQRPQDEDVIALVEPLIIARNPAAEFKRNFRVRGASRSDHIFDFRHGKDVIDVLQPWPQSTGGAMRKAGDVQNGPMSDMIKPLFIVDDRHDPDRAFNEIEILGSITRAMPLTRLMASTMH